MWFKSKTLGIYVRLNVDPARYFHYYTEAEKVHHDWRSSLDRDCFDDSSARLRALQHEVEEETQRREQAHEGQSAASFQQQTELSPNVSYLQQQPHVSVPPLRNSDLYDQSGTFIRPPNPPRCSLPGFESSPNVSYPQQHPYVLVPPVHNRDLYDESGTFIPPLNPPHYSLGRYLLSRRKTRIYFD
ncbi:uncharacterized protein JCM6883_000509 [Sporobolomyces salmoneus]|uniref:uncharacterized protein n=1 Tax=Sporobolomyces salmoneus TaxID=183962 RepID=UPI003178B902